MTDLATRRRRPERMDDPALDADLHAAALAGLSRINALSRVASVLWARIAPLAREGRGSPLRVLDVASGGGDVPLRLWRRARRAGLDVEVHGSDVSPDAVECARRRALRAGAGIQFHVLDALTEVLPTGYDVVTCSLFLHHLDEGDAVTFLSKARAAARRTVLIDDLQRGRLGYGLAWAGTRLLSRSDVVHTDGPRSVEGAFTAKEALAMAERAGWTDVRVARHWPCRWLLVGAGAGAAG